MHGQIPSFLGVWCFCKPPIIVILSSDVGLLSITLLSPPINGANSAADIIFEKTHTFIASTLTYDFHISFLAFIYLNQYIVFLNTRQSVGTHIRANFQTLYYLTPPAYLPRITAGIIYRLLIMLHNSCHLLISKALIVTGQQSQGRLTVSFKLGAFLTQLHTGK